METIEKDFKFKPGIEVACYAYQYDEIVITRRVGCDFIVAEFGDGTKACSESTPNKIGIEVCDVILGVL